MGHTGQVPGVSLPDEDVLRRSIDDPDAFGEIFDRHYGRIHSYLARRIGPGRAEDLAGETFRAAFVDRRRFDPAQGEVRPWLYGIAHNVLRRHLRDGERAERAWARLRAWERTPDARGDLDDLVERADAALRSATVQRALDRLRPEDREVLVLYAVEELSYAEIAAITGTPIGTVRSRLSRARTRMRSALRPVAEPSPDGATT